MKQVIQFFRCCVRCLCLIDCYLASLTRRDELVFIFNHNVTVVKRLQVKLQIVIDPNAIDERRRRADVDADAPARRVIPPRRNPPCLMRDKMNNCNAGDAVTLPHFT